MNKSFFSRQYMIYALSTTIAMIIVIAVFAQISTNRNILNIYGKQMQQAMEIRDNHFQVPIPAGILTFHPEDRMIILDKEQQVILDSSETDENLTGKTIQHSSVSKIFSGQSVQEINSFANTAGNLMVMTGIPVLEKEQVVGAVVIQTSYQSIKDDMAYMYRLLSICLVVIVIVTFSTFYGFSSTLSTSFQEFNEVTRSISNGDFTSRVSGIYDSELNELARNLNHMAEALASLEDYRRDFLANVSHDIRSPLTSIRGFVQAILDGTIQKENEEKYLKIVMDETDRLTKMTNDILLLSKMENKKIKLNISTIDINAIIIRVMDQFEQAIREKRMELKLDLYPEPLMVCVDPNHIQRVIANLVDNAIKFCSPGDTITIKAVTIYNKAEITVSDNGPGIAKEELPYIWDRFHKVDRSRGQDKKGIGLGLSIIKEIIRTHGESINVYSEPGVGTRFVFTLPLDKEKKKG